MEGRNGKKWEEEFNGSGRNLPFPLHPSSPVLIHQISFETLFWHPFFCVAILSRELDLKQQSHWVHCWVTACARPASTSGSPIPPKPSADCSSSVRNLRFLLLTHFTGPLALCRFGATNSSRVDTAWTATILVNSSFIFLSILVKCNLN